MDLSFADLANSVLDEVYFDDSTLDCISFRSAVIEATEFNRTRLLSADFREAIVLMSTFRDAHFPFTTFKSARKLSASFVGGFADEAIFDHANISSTFKNTVMKHTSWRHAHVRGGSFEGVLFVIADFTDMRSDGVLFDRSKIRVESLASLDLNGTIIPADGFELGFRSEVSPGRWALFDIAILRALVRKAIDTGNFGFADTLYRAQKELELRATDPGPRKVWSQLQGAVYGWGTRPGLLLTWICVAISLSAGSMLLAAEFGSDQAVINADGRIATQPASFRGIATALLVSASYFFAISFPSDGPSKSPIVHLSFKDRTLRPQGASSRIAAASWAVGKLGLYFLADTIARQYFG